jgi:hypothetical protein
MKIFRRLFIVVLIFVVSLQAAVADMVVFSYNRPIQLYAFLESAEKLMTGAGEIHVIYRADTEEFSTGYDVVAHDFDYVIFHKQGSDPRSDFKPLTMQTTFGSPSNYIIFAVDDIIVKDFCNLSDCIDQMEQQNAYGFYLRMGRHITWCYSWNQPQNLPPMKEVSPGLFAWKFSEGTHDWNYPHSVDMTLLRKKEVRANFDRLSFTNPNTLEGYWANLANPIMNRLGLCYEKSKIVNVPLNRVQLTYSNRNMDLYTPEELLAIFNEGKKIDIEPLFQWDNPGPHSEYEPTFIER